MEMEMEMEKKCHWCSELVGSTGTTAMVDGTLKYFHQSLGQDCKNEFLKSIRFKQQPRLQPQQTQFARKGVIHLRQG
jgi:hypothetical protein